MKILKHLLMNEAAGELDGVGGGAPASADPVPDDSGTGQSASGSVLSQGAGEGGAANDFDFVPEKYRVFGEGESFDIEASAKKLSEGYSNLAKRLGSDDTPPETPEEYSIDAESLGEGFDAEAFMKDEGTQGFLKRMHAKGLTNAQVQEVVEYGLKEWAPQIAGGEQALTEEACSAALREEWATDSEFETQVGHAFKALKAVAGDDLEKLEGKYGNDPDFIKVMAKFGREMSEDSPPTETLTQGGETIEELMSSEAYNNPKHPQHKQASEKVRLYFEKKHGTTPVV